MRQKKRDHHCGEVLIFLILLSFNADCSKPSNETHLEPSQFAKIYAETIIISLNRSKKDSLPSPLTETLNKFGVNRSEFQESIKYYNSKPQLWQEVFAIVLTELEKEKAD